MYSISESLVSSSVDFVFFLHGQQVSCIVARGARNYTVVVREEDSVIFDDFVKLVQFHVALSSDVTDRVADV